MKSMIYLMVLTNFIFADFDWGENGIPVRQGYHIEWFRSGDIDSDGKMIIVWSDTRTSSRDVYAQKVDQSGNTIWTENGKIIAGGDGRQEDPIFISDNSGGGFISWRSYANDPVYGELYAQYIDSNGNTQWVDKLISGDSKIRVNSQQNMCSDREGGAYVTWYADGTADDGNYYGVHLKADGSTTAPAKLIDTDIDYGNVSLESAGNGDGVIAWKEGPMNSENIYAQRLQANHSANTIDKVWNSGNPLEVCTSDGRQLAPKVTYYSDDYVVVVWEDWASPSVSGIGANFISSSGVLKFSSDGDADLVFTMESPSTPFPRVKASDTGAFVVWLSASDIHSVQKLTPSNINEWGAPISLTGVSQEQARLTADGNGGVFITWENENTISIQHLDSSGNKSFNNPPILSDLNTEQFYPLVRSDGDNGAFVVWADGPLNYNGIASLSLDYRHISTTGTPTSCDDDLLNSAECGISFLYGFGGQIKKSSTKAISIDGNKNLIYWQDYRNGIYNPQTYGSIGGEADSFESVYLLSEYPYQDSPQIVQANEYIFFMGFSNQGGEVYFQRMDKYLNLLDDAVQVYDSGNQQSSDESRPLLSSWGDGNVFYGFSEPSGNGDIYLQKYDSNGNEAWDIPQLIANEVGDEVVQGLFPTDDGGCIIIYDFLFYPNFSLKLAKINSNGMMVENWENVLLSTEGDKGYFEDAVQTSDGLFVTWRNNDKELFGKHIPFENTNPSNLNTINISTNGEHYTSSTSLDFSSELNEVLTCWQGETGAVYNIHCATINISNLTVTEEIVIYEDYGNSQKNPSVIATERSSYLVTWEDERNGNYSDLYIQEISSGEGQMETGGEILCDAVFNQYNSQLNRVETSANKEAYLLLWEDDRSSGKEFVTNIFSQKINLLDCVSLGDLNGDGGWNVLDIVTLANCVLAENCADLPNGCAGDLNGDGGWNVLDIVTLANCVLVENCGGRVDDASEASLIKKDNKLSFEADGFIGGVQMTLSHGSDFTIEMTDRALFADYLTTGNETRLLVISPETEDLFSFTGEFEITEIIVANSQDEVSVDLPIAASFNLSDAYPNPFNPVTTMTLTMPMAGEMTVEVYNLLGQSVAILTNGYKDAGTYNLTWDASDAASGMYFMKAQADGFTKTQKLMLVK